MSTSIVHTAQLIVRYFGEKTLEDTKTILSFDWLHEEKMVEQLRELYGFEFSSGGYSTSTPPETSTKEPITNSTATACVEKCRDEIIIEDVCVDETGNTGKCRKWERQETIQEVCTCQ